jgi:uncharacterized membrane protein YhfC
MVPTASIVILIINAIIGFVLPVCLVWWLVKKYKINFVTVLIGAATFFIFALILESMVHAVVLKGPRGEAIQGNALYYALYGGLMAGLFEETGRFLSMKFLMKKEPTRTLPAIAYGAGHGGIEVILVFAFSMISSLVLALMINAGQADALLAKAPAEAQAQLQEQFSQLETTAPAELLTGVWERISALILHLSLSVLVWAAVRKAGKWIWLYPAAILLHALVDGVTVILVKGGVGNVAIEFILMAMAVAIAAIAWMVAGKAFCKAE